MPIVPSIGTNLGSGWSRFLKSAPLGDSAFGDVLADQLRFRVLRSGATSVEDVAPDSRAARTLWEQPHTRRFAQGVLDLAGEVSGDGGAIRGFSLSTSVDGYVANRAVHDFMNGTSPTRDAYLAAIDAARTHVTGTTAVRKGAWIHLGPARSEGFMHALRHPEVSRDALTQEQRLVRGEGTKTLLHELNHVESVAPAPWLSEGKAEVLARWPGRVPHAGDRMGIDVPQGIGRRIDRRGGPYREEVDAVRALLRLAGLDPRRSSDFAAAERLLNGTRPQHLAGVLADRIAERHARTATEHTELRRRIVDLVEHAIAPDGEHADPRGVQKLARDLERARRVRMAQD